MDEALDTVNRAAGPVLVILLVALLVYVALRVIGRLVGRWVDQRIRDSSADPTARAIDEADTRKRLRTVTGLVDWIFRVLIIGAVAIAILVALGLTPLIVAFLLVVVIVAVVARDILRDYAGGFLIVLENQFSIGDWIRIGADYGEVESLSLRRTILRTEGGDAVSIPNGDIRTVTNRTRGWARINVEIGIADIRDLARARTAIDEAGRALLADPTVSGSVLEVPRFTMITRFDDDGIRLGIWGRVRAADRFVVEGEYRRHLLEALAAVDVDVLTSRRIRIVDDGPRPET
jgi:small conductance mechanosensitive channel